MSDNSRSATSHRCSASANLAVVDLFQNRSLAHSWVILCLKPGVVCKYMTSEMIVRLYNKYQIFLALNIVIYSRVLFTMEVYYTHSSIHYS
jgi:hypothetical protein